VLRWTRRGELPAIKLPGGAIRYRETDLDAWLELHETGAATEKRQLTRHRAHAEVSLVTPANPPDIRPARTEEEP
jgi:hypothetical protein